MRISYLLTVALLLSLASSGECQTVGQGNGEGFFGGWFAGTKRGPYEILAMLGWGYAY
jgi:hypothetical protein